ncbi:MAG TPA: ferrous iron transport protein B [Pirellulales bacterium]|nr:ferrous iron transport protein B [Pirellulales bacterium]
MTRSDPSTVCVALIGNPNTGKSTLFSALAGVRQRVGNYPGVTVEKKIGHLTHGNERFTLIDLPGTYSLAPRSPDEMVAVDVLLGRRDDAPRPDVVLCIVDASNLQRNLYVVSQALELGLPTIVALNMIDVARARGMSIDVPRLSQSLGVPVIAVQANRRRGIEQLKTALAAAARQTVAARPSPFPVAFQQEVTALCERLGGSADASTTAKRSSNGHAAPPRYLVERLLLDTTGYLQDVVVGRGDAGLSSAIQDARGRLATAGCQVPAIEAVSRYAWINDKLTGIVTRPPERPVTFSDRLDRVLTHRVWGTLAFALTMLIVFQAVFSWAGPAQDLIDVGVGRIATFAEEHMSEGALRSLVVDGLIGGVGGVLAFLPQIFILFFFIALLEDCGYMARAAYLMDKLMVRVGLSGKSFIPLLSSFACAIPGIMATRTIENRRDRLTTILIAPLMSCSARLPVYALLIAVFIPDRSFLGGLLNLKGLTLAAMYLIGIVTATVVALVLKKTLLRGPTPPFVMELPSYKIPAMSIVLHRMLERGWSFVRRAGTLIVAVAVVVWASLYYPHDPAIEAPYAEQRVALESQLEAMPATAAERQAIDARLAEIDHRVAGAYQQQSWLGRLGHWIEPAVRPLGWDWRIGCAAIASFPAREVVVATLGIIYNLGEVDVENTSDAGLDDALRQATWDGTDQKVFNVPVALSLMVFFALCAQCAATLVVIKRETNSWYWPAFTFAYMTALAYLGALVTYQVGMRIS